MQFIKMARYFKSKKSIKKSSYTKPRFFRKKSNPGFTKKVLSVVRSQEEKKEQNYVSGLMNNANWVNAALRGNNVIHLLPSSSGSPVISQGSGQGQRTGNAINITKATMKLFVFPVPYDATTNSIPMPQVALCYIFSLKPQDRSLAAARTICNNTFFAAGSSSIGFTGDIQDWLRNPNQDQVTIHKKWYMKIGSAVYSSNTGAQNNQYNFANNDFKMAGMKTIDLTKFYPKTIRFNDTTNDCSNNPLYFVMSPCDADGGANASTTAAIPLTWEVWIENRYTDA